MNEIWLMDSRIGGESMGLVSMDEAKAYLRVDSADEDSLIQSLLDASLRVVFQVSRLSDQEWTAILEDRGETDAADAGLTSDEIIEYQAVLKTAVLFTLGYLFEHREEADHHELVMTLRNLLFGVREGRPKA